MFIDARTDSAGEAYNRLDNTDGVHLAGMTEITESGLNNKYSVQHIALSGIAALYDLTLAIMDCEQPDMDEIVLPQEDFGESFFEESLITTPPASALSDSRFTFETDCSSVIMPPEQVCFFKAKSVMIKPRCRRSRLQ